MTSLSPRVQWEMAAAEWKELSARLIEDQSMAEKLLDRLNALVYPLDGIQVKDCERLLQCMSASTALHSSSLLAKCAQLCHSLVVTQNVPISSTTASKLFHLFSSSLSSYSNPTEPLYALSGLVPLVDTISSTMEEDLLNRTGPVVAIVVSGSIPHQRAALNFISSLVLNMSESSPLLMSSVLETVSDCLVSSLSSQPLTSDGSETILPTRLQLSLLRTVHDLLGHVTSLQPLPYLPSLLSSLRALYNLGLPGHQHTMITTPIIPHQHKVMVDGKHQVSSVAGPRHHRTSRGRSRHDLSGSEEEGAATGGGRGRRGRERRRDVRRVPASQRSPVATSDSDSDISDGEGGTPSLLKLLRSRVRYQSLVCVTALLQSLDSHSKFSYGLPLLPDSPRGPTAPPTILTSISKDPYHKCRRGAVGVLCSLLEGSKPFLAAANDRVCPSRPFTPYSTTLGGVVRELHRCLLLAITAEPHPQTLSLIIKCLSLLVANSPYPHLSEPYLTRICTTIEPLAANKDSTVAVGTLTCLGAVLSTHPPLVEVEKWLGQRQPPWVMDYCLRLLKSATTPMPLQVESVQLLTALVKFYFHTIQSSWTSVGMIYSSHLSKSSGSLQLHGLRLLEELGRSTASLSETEKQQSVVEWWEDLMSGPLTYWLQMSSSSPPTCAEAAKVLSTIGGNTLAALKTPSKMLVLTLLLGLSKDQNSSVRTEAVRALGVFTKYSTLWSDPGFMTDSAHCILQGLDGSVSVRVQAGWALGNITESVSKRDELSFLWEPLSVGVVKSLEDIDRVRVNGVRAAGYLLKGLNKESMQLCSSLSSVCSLLAHSIISGQGVKTRWNACFACYNVFNNEFFIENCQKDMAVLVDALCSAVISCVNFKVRTNAALALGTPPCYSLPGQLQQVWTAVVTGLEASDTQVDFAEYRQAQSLKEELCYTACQLLATLTVEELAALSTSPPTAPLCTNLRLFVDSMDKLSSSEDASYKKRAYSHTEVVTRAVDRLQQLVGELGTSQQSSESLLFCNTLLKQLEIKPDVI